jgi:hypothetical protein
MKDAPAISFVGYALMKQAICDPGFTPFYSDPSAKAPVFEPDKLTQV